MARPFTTQLTTRQERVLDWVYSFAEKHKMPPTVREIGAAFKITPRSVFDFLKALERKGYLKRGDLGARSLELPARKAASRKPQRSERVDELRILGHIAAGKPIYATEDDLGELNVDRSVLNGRPGFVLVANGDSMIEAGILDGDYVIVRRQEFARDGDIVVALIDEEEATVKRFHREGKRIRLQPANRTMEPIYVTPESLRIQGCVVGVQRFYGTRRGG